MMRLPYHRHDPRPRMFPLLSTDVLTMTSLSHPGDESVAENGRWQTCATVQKDGTAIKLFTFLPNAGGAPAVATTATGRRRPPSRKDKPRRDVSGAPQHGCRDHAAALSLDDAFSRKGVVAFLGGI